MYASWPRSARLGELYMYTDSGGHGGDVAVDLEAYVSIPLGWAHSRRLWGVCLQGCTCGVHVPALARATELGEGCPGRPSLPTGTALGQAMQNGLQVLLVGTDLSEVVLEALDLQLLLLRLLL